MFSIENPQKDQEVQAASFRENNSIGSHSYHQHHDFGRYNDNTQGQTADNFVADVNIDISNRLNCIEMTFANLSDQSQAEVHDDCSFGTTTIESDDDSDDIYNHDCHHGSILKRRELFWQSQKNNSASPLSVFVGGEVSRLYAPPGLEIHFDTLYRTLRLCLLSSSSSSLLNSTTQTTSNKSSQSNASAFLQGTRGSGKTLVVNRVLSALDDEIRYCVDTSDQSNIHTQNRRPHHKFRVVRLNGLTVPGYSVPTVVREILTQLSEAAFREGKVNMRYRKALQSNCTNTIGKENQNLDVKNRPQCDNNIHNDTSVSNSSKRRKLSSKAGKKIEFSRDNKEETGPQYRQLNFKDDYIHDARLEKLLRLKQTSFSNHLQLLSEILQMASVDGIPILFILEEMDAFLGVRESDRGSATYGNNTNSSSLCSSGIPSESSFTNDRQLLLYHILDRVATSGSFCSLVGISSSSSLMLRMEKRIKSRAEGTAEFIHFGPCSSFPKLIQILLSKIGNDTDDQKSIDSGSDSHQASNYDRKLANPIRTEMANLLSTHEHKELCTTVKTGETHRLYQKYVYEILQHDYKLGKDLRWFSRVFYVSFSMYRMHLLRILNRRQNEGDYSDCSLVPVDRAFQAKFIFDALAEMGGSIALITNREQLDTTKNTSVSRDSNNCATLNLQENMIKANPRLRALEDLSGPQVAFLLSCRRILVREGMRDERSKVMPLTVDRALDEYRSTYKGTSGRYNSRMLRKAFQDLLATGLIRAASDHIGTGPFQYNLNDSIFANVDENTAFAKIPLHLIVDVHRELKMAIDNNMLHCTTALREWGRKVN